MDGALLLEAVEDGHIDNVKQILQGLSASEVNIIHPETKDTPLIIASERGHLEIVNHLLNHGADVMAKNVTNTTAIHAAASRDQVDIIHVLHKHGGDLNAIDTSGMSPLHLAVQKKFIRTVKLLLKLGADTNLCDNTWQRVPLYDAVKQGDFRMAQMLLEKDAEVNVQDTTGTTPLHEAVADNNLHLARLLLKYGADINIKENITGTSPLDQVKASEMKQLLTIFVQKASRDNIRERRYSSGSDSGAHSLSGSRENILGDRHSYHGSHENLLSGYMFSLPSTRSLADSVEYDAAFDSFKSKHSERKAKRSASLEDLPRIQKGVSTKPKRAIRRTSYFGTSTESLPGSSKPWKGKHSTRYSIAGDRPEMEVPLTGNLPLISRQPIVKLSKKYSNNFGKLNTDMRMKSRSLDDMSSVGTMWKSLPKKLGQANSLQRLSNREYIEPTEKLKEQQLEYKKPRTMSFHNDWKQDPLYLNERDFDQEQPTGKDDITLEESHVTSSITKKVGDTADSNMDNLLPLESGKTHVDDFQMNKEEVHQKDYEAECTTETYGETRVAKYNNLVSFFENEPDSPKYQAEVISINHGQLPSESDGLLHGLSVSSKSDIIDKFLGMQTDDVDPSQTSKQLPESMSSVKTEVSVMQWNPSESKTDNDNLLGVNKFDLDIVNTSSTDNTTAAVNQFLDHQTELQDSIQNETEGTDILKSDTNSKTHEEDNLLDDFLFTNTVDSVHGNTKGYSNHRDVNMLLDSNQNKRVNETLDTENQDADNLLVDFSFTDTAESVQTKVDNSDILNIVNEISNPAESTVLPLLQFNSSKSNSSLVNPFETSKEPLKPFNNQTQLAFDEYNASDKNNDAQKDIFDVTVDKSKPLEREVETVQNKVDDSDILNIVNEISNPAESPVVPLLLFNSQNLPMSKTEIEGKRISEIETHVTESTQNKDDGNSNIFNTVAEISNPNDSRVVPLLPFKSENVTLSNTDNVWPEANNDDKNVTEIDNNSINPYKTTTEPLLPLTNQAHLASEEYNGLGLNNDGGENIFVFTDDALKPFEARVENFIANTIQSFLSHSNVNSNHTEMTIDPLEQISVETKVLQNTDTGSENIEAQHDQDVIEITDDIQNVKEKISNTQNMERLSLHNQDVDASDANKELSEGMISNIQDKGRITAREGILDNGIQGLTGFRSDNNIFEIKKAEPVKEKEPNEFLHFAGTIADISDFESKEREHTSLDEMKASDKDSLSNSSISLTEPRMQEENQASSLSSNNDLTDPLISDNKELKDLPKWDMNEENKARKTANVKTNIPIITESIREMHPTNQSSVAKIGLNITSSKNNERPKTGSAIKNSSVTDNILISTERNIIINQQNGTSHTEDSSSCRNSTKSNEHIASDNKIDVASSDILKSNNLPQTDVYSFVDKWLDDQFVQEGEGKTNVQNNQTSLEKERTDITDSKQNNELQINTEAVLINTTVVSSDFKENKDESEPIFKEQNTKYINDDNHFDKEGVENPKFVSSNVYEKDIINMEQVNGEYNESENVPEESHKQESIAKKKSISAENNLTPNFDFKQQKEDIEEQQRKSFQHVSMPDEHVMENDNTQQMFNKMPSLHDMLPKVNGENTSKPQIDVISSYNVLNPNQTENFHKVDLVCNMNETTDVPVLDGDKENKLTEKSNVEFLQKKEEDSILTVKEPAIPFVENKYNKSQIETENSLRRENDKISKTTSHPNTKQETEMIKLKTGSKPLKNYGSVKSDSTDQAVALTIPSSTPTDQTIPLLEQMAEDRHIKAQYDNEFFNHAFDDADSDLTDKLSNISEHTEMSVDELANSKSTETIAIEQFEIVDTNGKPQAKSPSKSNKKKDTPSFWKKIFGCCLGDIKMM